MTQLALFAAGRSVNTLVLGIGDWVRTGDGTLVEITAFPSIAQVEKWNPMEVRQADGTIWRAPEREGA